MANRKLLFSVTLDDCKIDTFRSGGKGGQNQNKRDTGVRITHPDSGAVGESRDQRTQFANKKNAFIRMANSKEFKSWIKLEASRKSGWDIDQEIWEQMKPKNLKVEYRNEKGKWEELTEGEY